MEQETINFEEFEKRIGVVFTDKTLLRRAMTHRSYINENQGVDWRHNERLEFLGDAVLELAVTRYLFDKYPDQPEGELTAFRAALVNTVTISDAAAKLDAEDYLLLSKGERRDTGRAREHILANTFEAIIGAIYLDQGYDAAERFIADNLYYRIEKIVSKGLHKDSKSLVQEKAQELLGITPNYEVLKDEGPDHDKVFLVGIYFNGEEIATGEGNSKQVAQQAAAEAALQLKGWR